ncbi:hypothetical protein RhiirA1_466459 [Rhizophagus irregularis]|uniref:Uncharacterized protein n=1 Tax=Rhizophagus irregularis TaxID=588596 RepID=A0A2I1F3A6_9GLOM|nr:hypothetical protein RhiirA1_466459 [Rhizophagus irregularis]PKY28855.1 hypothetical protein RhiirB3_445231 [Rhizophagus irregularis]
MNNEFWVLDSVYDTLPERIFQADFLHCRPPAVFTGMFIIRWSASAATVQYHVAGREDNQIDIELQEETIISLQEKTKDLESDVTAKERIIIKKDEDINALKLEQQPQTSCANKFSFTQQRKNQPITDKKRNTNRKNRRHTTGKNQIGKDR